MSTEWDSTSESRALHWEASQSATDPNGLPSELAGDPVLWEPRYGHWDRKRSLSQLDCLAAVPLEHVRRVDLDLARMTVHRIFDQWDRPSDIPPADFTFCAPGRLTRSDSRYSGEIYELFPALSFDRRVAQRFLAGIPPFIIDRYGPGGSGVTLWTPVQTDMMFDLPSDEAVRVFLSNLHKTLEFGQSFGVKLAGLAATLPSLTRFGQLLQVEGVRTTTGHSGTIGLIADLIDQLEAEGQVTKNRRPLGILGCGAIGVAAAMTLGTVYPGWPIALADNRTKKTDEALGMLTGKGLDAISMAVPEMLQRCDVIVAAVTTPVDLDGLGVADMAGASVIDDSQPGCFDPAQLSRRGGKLYWPFARDDSPEGFATRGGVDGRAPFLYGAGSIGMPTPAHLFGCEAEVAVLSHTGNQQLALDRPVRPEDVVTARRLFTEVNVRSGSPAECLKESS